jgi:hypothetical protein
VQQTKNRGEKMNTNRILKMTPKERRKYAVGLSKSDKKAMIQLLSSKCKPGEKVCSRCLEYLPLEKFYEDKKAPDEHAYWCADCMSNYRKTPKNSLTMRIIKKLLMPHAIRIKTNDDNIIGIYKQRGIVNDLPKVIGGDFRTEIIPHKDFVELKIKP